MVAQNRSSTSSFAKVNMKKSIGAKTILYPAPVLIVETYDKKGNP